MALAPPKSLALPNATVTATVFDADDAAVVRVEARGGVALYVVLTSELQGRPSRRLWCERTRCCAGCQRDWGRTARNRCCRTCAPR